VLAVCAKEAAIVRRVFRLFAEGKSLKAIADTLKRDGIPAPCDRHGYAKKVGKGWGHPTIRAMLRNERYIGRVVWNRRKWERSPRTGKRVYRERPQEDHVARVMPELAIISPELWAAVQKRVSAARETHGRPAGGTKHPNMLSALLRCGECGASMVVVGARTKAGKRYPVFGCAAHRSKGGAVCPNSLTISEGKLTRALMDALYALLDGPGLKARFVDQFAKRLEARKPTADSERVALETEVAETDARIARLTEAFAKVGHSDALALRLRGEEARLKDLRHRLGNLAPAADTATALPEPDKIARYLERVEKLGLEAPAAAREALSTVLEAVHLHPVERNGKRVYEARTSLKIQGPVTLGGDRASEKVGCGGRI
jgi:site-specific DNA recombinase